MRRTSFPAALVLNVAGALLATPVSAMPVDDPASASGTKVTCHAELIGVTPDRRVRYAHIKNGKLVDQRRSRERLGFSVTAWGYYDQRETRQGGRVLRLSAISGSGHPRQVSVTQARNGRITDLGSTQFFQDGWRVPSQFADGYGPFAYTIRHGVLKRWRTTRLHTGRLSYTDSVRIGTGYDAVTSLTAAKVFEIKGVRKDLAFATTSDGALLRLTGPVKKPTRTTVRQLADTGYAGVTELVWSTCTDVDHIWLGAIDPVAGQATWTTIKDVTGKPRVTLQGEIRGGDSWDLTAAY